MSYAYGRTSKARLRTTDERLQRVFNAAIAIYDITILCGFRGEIAQNRAFAEGNSKVRWPDGDHNDMPSKAVDAGPYDPSVRNVNWNINWRTPEGRANKARFYQLAGIIIGIGASMGYKIRWGGDWDGDRFFDDQTFNDLVHFEYDGELR